MRGTAGVHDTAAFTGAARITRAIREANDSGRPAIAAFLTAGFPDRADFESVVRRVATEADLIELGVPFSDPMADGLTIQRSSRAALASGVSLPWIVELVARIRESQDADYKHDTPILLMSYMNPLMAYGLSRLAADASGAGAAGLIVPDLPLEESDELRSELGSRGMALVQLVTPATPPERLERVCEASGGFVYAVTMKGTTGERVDAEGVGEYLERVRSVSRLPVLAGFGVRTPADVRSLGSHADGVIVGSAIVEAQEQGLDAAAFVGRLRGGGQSASARGGS